jgi:hypothetical protein
MQRIVQMSAELSRLWSNGGTGADWSPGLHGVPPACLREKSSTTGQFSLRARGAGSGLRVAALLVGLGILAAPASWAMACASPDSDSDKTAVKPPVC